MARGEHDRPDPSLIVEGSRRVQPSKRIQGHDYPITPLEELRSKGTQYSPCATHVCSESTLIGNTTTGGKNPSGSNRNFPEVTLSGYQQENTYITDTPKGDTLRGDALREDGTLKDASEIEWLHSPSDEHKLSVPNQDEDTFEWPESPSAPWEYNSSIDSGNRWNSQKSNESRSEGDNGPKEKVS